MQLQNVKRKPRIEGERNERDFQKKVLEAATSRYWSTLRDTAGPCKRLAPTLDEVAKDVEGKAYVYKLDVDYSQDITKYRVSSVPHLILFKDGQPAKKTIGAQPHVDADVRLMVGEGTKAYDTVVVGAGRA